MGRSPSRSAGGSEPPGASAAAGPPHLEPFPDPRLAHSSGLLAIGGDLSAQRLLNAYMRGIFPWYSEGEPILWWSPDPRFVLDFNRFRVSRSLLRSVRRGRFVVRADSAFDAVVDHCARRVRPGQSGTWITAEMRAAYARLHAMGYAHSIEAFEGEALVGGIYGVSLGGVFCGESMFYLRRDASKVALFHLVHSLRAWGFDFLDCQVHTDHMESLGASNIPRAVFLRRLAESLKKPSRLGRWSLEPVAT